MVEFWHNINFDWGQLAKYVTSLLSECMEQKLIPQISAMKYSSTGNEKKKHQKA